MRTFEYAIIDKLGIHARPAGMFVKEVKKFDSKPSCPTFGTTINETVQAIGY
ncbi:HPr family phosphocarrier protein [Clostridiaceae bacterium]|nr:HPr family phosphocarrier protein [Clostridiaceae bacterium]